MGSTETSPGALDLIAEAVRVDGGVVAAVLAAEAERCRATGEQDFGALDALLDDSLTHTHMNGRVDDKAALLANIAARPRVLRRGPLAVRVFGDHGDCAVMTGPQYLNLGSGWMLNQATQTWIHRDGRWRLVAFHASTDDPTPTKREPDLT